MDQRKEHSSQPPQRQLEEDILIKQETSEIPVVTVVDSRRPAPFVPDFAWRPGISDYPVALIASSSAMRRKATLADAGWGDMPTLDDVGPHRTPAKYIPHALAVAAIVAAVMSNSFWLPRSESTPEDVQNPPAALVDDAADVEDEDIDSGDSLLDRTQQSGQGGIEEGPTATLGTEDEDVDEGAAAADPTAEIDAAVTPEATATPRIMLPNPSGPAPTVTVQVPQAGVTEYVAEGWETLHDVAAHYGLSVTTLLWANGISDPGDLIEEGTELVVPPVDGVLHTVSSSDTIQRIADRYGVYPDTITEFEANGIGGSPSLTLGQKIMVPGGKIHDWGAVQEYTVQEGDNLWVIASYYGLDPQSLAWANTLPRPELIAPGQVLEIPPGDGALITVEAGDHVEAIAERFGVDASAIRAYGFNNLAGDAVLQQGQKLLVPGAPLPDLENEEPSELDASTVAEGAVAPATGTFIWPTSGFISQEFHEHHNGLDIANKEWTPVNAADGGIVIFAGWNDYGLGYAVGVDHGNGYQTWYGHLLNQPYVEVGQVVWQGGYLGPMGSTGKSTGPHLHFIVMKDGVYQNPLNYLQR